MTHETCSSLQHSPSAETIVPSLHELTNEEQALSALPFSFTMVTSLQKSSQKRRKIPSFFKRLWCRCTVNQYGGRLFWILPGGRRVKAAYSSSSSFSSCSCEAGPAAAAGSIQGSGALTGGRDGGRRLRQARAAAEQSSCRGRCDTGLRWGSHWVRHVTVIGWQEEEGWVGGWGVGGGREG